MEGGTVLYADLYLKELPQWRVVLGLCCVLLVCTWWSLHIGFPSLSEKIAYVSTIYKMDIK